ncbi:MAG TPA: DUF4331 domain-containing protein [Methylomirabilota bacterium]|jgi:hypothetical protein|nr:DUF4331 domain-containing protein [Methylomirabilota bacterium]
MRKKKVYPALTAAVLMLLQGMPLPSAHAASHREAPLIANDPTADITDFYMFRSWEDPGKVVFILNTIPGQEPSSGPNYYNFGDDVAYRINIDTNGDGKAEDIIYEFRFTTEIRGATAALQLPVANAAVPPITALDGAGSEGLGVRQRYTVTEIRGKNRTNLGVGSLFAVPSNMGPRTMPDYEALAAKGIYSLSNGGRVFAGQRDETFYIDLGAVFDTINLRAPAPILSSGQDADDTQNFGGVDHFSGFNVNSIAIEAPISSLTNNANAVIGAYASTHRNRKTVRRGAPLRVSNEEREDLLEGVGKLVQVQRLANPLVNEVIIGTPQKDLWNATEPEDEARFLGFYRSPRLTTVLNLLFGASFPDTGRNDLTNVLLKYAAQTQDGTCSKANPCSELLRLNLGVTPTPPVSQKRLTVLAGDNAGWPNGRRPNDDVTDVALRVVAGLLVGAAVPNLGDGVNFNIGAPGAGTSDGPGYGSVAGNRLDVTANGIAAEFPFLPTPHDGRNRRHIDCGEPGGNAC